jgi:hypothetical protein
MLRQPGGDVVPLVGVVVVEDDVQLAPRVGTGDLVQEGNELGRSVALEAAVGDPPGGDLKRRE